MNVKNILLALCFVSFGFVGQAQNALEHMEDITQSFDNLKNDTWGYMKAVTEGKSARMVDNKRQTLIKKYGEESRRLAKLDASDLRTSMQEFIDLSITVLKEDYDKILDMEDIAEQSYDAMEAYMMANSQASEKLNKASEDLIAAQGVYAKANDIELVEGKMDSTTKKIEKASNALEYYHKVYLIYFKAYKQELYALEAASVFDVAALDQNTSALGNDATEGLNKLKELGGYSGDAGLKTATEKVLRFYEDEAKETFPGISDFFVKKEQFEAADKLIKSKNQNKLTQKEIDNYNNALDEYNKVIEVYNSGNDRTNAERTKVMNAWDVAVKRFFEKHAR